MKITHSLTKLFHQLSDVDILLKKHPVRSNLEEELATWHTGRNLSHNAVEKFNAIASYHNIKLNEIPVFESCVIGYSNTKSCKEFCNKVLAYMKFLGEDGQLIITNQCVISLIMRIHPISFKYIIQNDFFSRYRHANWDTIEL